MTEQHASLSIALPTPSGKRGPGRPHGLVPFRKDKGRFEVVLFCVLKHYKLDDPTASRLAVILASPRVWVLGNRVSPDLAWLRLDPRAHSISKHRNLPSKVKIALARLKTDPEAEQWVAASYYGLRVLIDAVLSNDGKKGAWAAAGLAQLGWSDLLTSFGTAFISATAQMPEMISWREAKQISKKYENLLRGARAAT